MPLWLGHAVFGLLYYIVLPRVHLNDNSLSMIIPNNFSCLELKILLPSTRANKTEFGVFKSKCDFKGFVISMLYDNH